jgi:acyl-CoA thioester hydrolase
MEGTTHVFPLRVYYEDTDFSGLVYHASYLRFMERGRSEFLRLSGAGHRGMLEAPEPLVWAVRRLEVEFLKPARIEDALGIRTRVLELAGARMRLRQSVLKEGVVLADAAVEVCVLNGQGRPRRLPDSTREKLALYLDPE